jgi:V-type H+-transporting ATPase subunit F
MSVNEAMSKRTLIATIAEEDTVTGLLLAGVGQIQDTTNDTNFLTVVPGKTTVEQIEEAFDKFTSERKDIAILLINQHLADLIRYKIETFTAAFPAILEIPSKDHPYDPEKDSILKRVRRLFGE